MIDVIVPKAPIFLKFSNLDSSKYFLERICIGFVCVPPLTFVFWSFNVDDDLVALKTSTFAVLSNQTVFCAQDTPVFSIRGEVNVSNLSLNPKY